MHWSIKSQLVSDKKTSRSEQIVNLLLTNRGLGTKSQVNAFLHPPDPTTLPLKSFGISAPPLRHSLTRINQAIANQEPILIYGDYDADGISATAILWLTLYKLGANVTPFIPHRERHGYGLSIKGIEDILTSSSPNHPRPSLIITVDNGIVAHQTADYINDQGIDLIITDHHQRSTTLPKAYSIVHSDQIAGCGVAWVLARELSKNHPGAVPHELLDLVAIGTVADLMPMIGINRALVKHGLSALNSTKRVGLLALIKEAGVQDQSLNAYHIGYVIGPRINAMGRLEHGLDALRLLCTTSADKATNLANLLGDTNKSRQDLTVDMTSLADELYRSIPNFSQHKVIIIDHQEFHEGVIGLIAGKLAETYHKPAIVISRGTKVSKASARSVKHINIIELIRTAETHLINAGGHPGAAGFTVETTKIDIFRQALIESAKSIDATLLKPSLDVECELEFSDLNLDLYDQLESFEPFGIGNQRPVFAVTAQVANLRLVGKDQQHLKLQLAPPPSSTSTSTNSNPGIFDPGIVSRSNLTIDAIGFNLAAANSNLKTGDTISLAFFLDKNVWNGRTTLQLMLKDIQSVDH